MQQKKPNAFIFAGANASGKSTFITHLLLNHVIFGEYINPDLILKDELELEETTENYLKVFQIAEERRYNAIKNSKDIIVETVFSTQEKIDFIYSLIESMYKNNICYITDNHNREATWLENILEDSIKVLQGDELKIVPKEHLQLCENIQNSSHTFGNTLEKTYTEKNKVLAKEIKK